MKNKVSLVKSSQDIVLAGAFAALLAVLSQVAVPLPSGVPITLQTFAVALAGYTLGAKRGTLSVAVYLLLGAIGLPVFAEMSAGVGVFVGPTGGFLFGFLLLACLCGLSSPWFGAFGLLAVHALGVLLFSAVMGVSVVQAVGMVSLPYLIKDVVSVVCAFFSARAVRRGLKTARLC